MTDAQLDQVLAIARQPVTDPRHETQLAHLARTEIPRLVEELKRVRAELAGIHAATTARYRTAPAAAKKKRGKR